MTTLYALPTVDFATIERLATLLDRADDTAAFREACALFASIDDDATFEIAVDYWPGLLNYGPRGEWCGSYRFETGYTN